jgi:ribose 5-phosphate isomerase B
MINKSKKNTNHIANKTIAIASDHAGYELKSFLILELEELGFKLIDLGTNDAEKKVDYPDFAKKLAKNIITKKSDFGILICGSGIGISIAANRFKEIRAALCSDVKSAKLAKNHNDANVICLGARSLKNQLALKIVSAFLEANFDGGRHQKRVAKLS